MVTSRHDRNLLGLPDKKNTIVGVVIDALIIVSFTVSAAIAISRHGDWSTVLFCAAGVLIGAIGIIREVRFYRTETLLRRRMGHHAHRADLAEQEIARLKEHMASPFRRGPQS